MASRGTKRPLSSRRQLIFNPTALRKLKHGMKRCKSQEVCASTSPRRLPEMASCLRTTRFSYSKMARSILPDRIVISYTHLRAHETPEHLVCRLLLEKKKKK